MQETFIDNSPDENYILRKTWGVIEVGITPMMYGYRIRAGVIGDGYCHLDYCAGPDHKEVETIYSLVLTILTKESGNIMLTGDANSFSNNDIAHAMFKKFPIQRTKPMVNDNECYMKLIEMCGPEVISVKLPDLQSLKIQQLIRYNPSFLDVAASLGALDD